MLATTLGGGAAAGLALTGCDIDPPTAPSASPSPGAAASERDGDGESDAVLVGEMVAALSMALATIAGAGAGVPALAPVLEEARTAHERHRDLLVSADPDSSAEEPDPVPVAPRSKAALRAVQASEKSLEGALRSGLLRARSGDLARTLASAAASTAQLRTTLDRPDRAEVSR